MSCLKCGDTGIKTDGTTCDCNYKADITFPSFMNVPMQYQGVQFSADMLDTALPKSYANYMEKLMQDCINHVSNLCKNIIICAPPNSGKSIFTYTVYGALNAKNVPVPDFLDILEVRQLMLNIYKTPDDKESLLYTSPIAIIKIPMDLPNKLAETISTLIERRVRLGGSTIFLYSGSKGDLMAQDTFGKFQAILGDGSYNSLDIRSFEKEIRNGT